MRRARPGSSIQANEEGMVTTRQGDSVGRVDGVCRPTAA